MKPMSLQSVRQAVGGRALSSISKSSASITCVGTDTRKMQPGSLFIAIKGETHDGHDHLPQAAAGGAVAALVQTIPTVKLPNLPMIQVPNTRLAMGKLATAVRQQMMSK